MCVCACVCVCVCVCKYRARHAEKQGGFDAMIAAMEAKYSKPKAPKTKKAQK